MQLVSSDTGRSNTEYFTVCKLFIILKLVNVLVPASPVGRTLAARNLAHTPQTFPSGAEINAERDITQQRP